MGFRKKYTVNRVSVTGSFDDTGTWVTGTTIENISIKASIQPLNNDEYQSTGFGEMAASTVKIYTSTRLRTAKQATSTTPAVEADKITYDGQVYKVVSVAPYQCGVINHYKCYAQEVDNNE